MKTNLILLVLLCNILCLSQIKYDGPYFNGLKGIDDSNKITHLFYRLKSCYDSADYYNYNNSVFKLDMDTHSDKVFLNDYTYWIYNNITDYQFLNNDVDNYIYNKNCGGTEGDSYIVRHQNNREVQIWVKNPVSSFFVSKQNVSLIFANSDCVLYSKDAGWNWDTLKSFANGEAILVAQSPLNDSVWFFINNNNLCKTDNMGVTFRKVNTAVYPLYYDVFFDKDNRHIYARYMPDDNKYYLAVSDNGGEAGSWKVVYTSNNRFIFATDNDKSGTVYLIDGRNELVSTDFAKSFEVRKSFDKSIIGFYKKPASDISYVMSRYKLWEVNGDSIKIIKKIPIPTHLLSYYPLAKGNKWIYNTTLNDNFTIYSGSGKKEVVGDTIMPNKLKYFIIKTTTSGFETRKSYSYERIDSAEGMVYRYDTNIKPNSERLVQDLTAFGGDSVFVSNEFNLYSGEPFICTGNNAILWNQNLESLSFYYRKDGFGAGGYTLSKNIGLINSNSQGDVSPLYKWEIKGCKIGDKIWGDTIYTDVKVNTETIIKKYQLRQNYPNPFNPVTTIAYDIQKAGRVNLTIYDILGQKIRELVNEVQTAGSYKVQFDASGLASGVYFYQLKTAEFSSVKKLLLQK